MCLQQCARIGQTSDVSQRIRRGFNSLPFCSGKAASWRTGVGRVRHRTCISFFQNIQAIGDAIALVRVLYREDGLTEACERQCTVMGMSLTGGL